MKLYNKKDCIFEDGIITCDGEVVGVSSRIHQCLCDLEKAYQMALYVSKQPDAQGGPSLDGFEFEDESKADLPVYIPETPALDAKVQETLAYLDDLDSVEFCKHMNQVVGQFAKLIEFTQKDKFLPGNGWKFSLHYVGNPLELTEGRLMDMLEFCVRQRDRLDKPFPIASDSTVLEF